MTTQGLPWQRSEFSWCFRRYFEFSVKQLPRRKIRTMWPTLAVKGVRFWAKIIWQHCPLAASMYPLCLATSSQLTVGSSTAGKNRSQAGLEPGTSRISIMVFDQPTVPAWFGHTRPKFLHHACPRGPHDFLKTTRHCTMHVDRVAEFHH